MQPRRRNDNGLAACIRAAQGRTLEPGSRHIPVGQGRPTRRGHVPEDLGRQERLIGLEFAGELHVRSDELARLEAALFLAREPLTTRRLAKLARLQDGTRARSLIKTLRQASDADGSAFRVEPIAGGYQLLTRAAFGPWIRRVVGQPTTGRVSPAALETLAIVAYRQPVSRAEIESIRGVGSEEMLRQLLERDLVAVGGRAEELGRPHVYVTTRRFLAAFGLSRIEDLPTLESFAGGDDDFGSTAADTENPA